MRRRARTIGIRSALAASLGASALSAAPVLRVQMSQHGDMTWLGNTSAQECAATARAPIVGTVPNCGANTGDSAPDVFWRSDDPAAGQARARTQNSVATARSTAVLVLPPGATVTYARLYWAAEPGTNVADTAVTIERPAAFIATATADQSFTATRAGNNPAFWYESTADVTALVRTNGSGAYRVSGIDSVDLDNLNSADPFVAWSIVVFYQLATDPLRNLALFDGLDLVQNGQPASATISGFQVPNAGFDAKLGVLTYEGDFTLTGDALVFNGVALTDAVNPADNFFNGSRSFLGIPVSVAGDLPQMDGLPASMSGLDLDIVDITQRVKAGDTSATVQATSSGDTYLIGAFATSIATFQPEFGTTTKSFVDLNGGLVVRGDQLEYTIVATNSGNDAAVRTVLVDPLPAGLTFVPGSIQITSGTNAGAKTDAAGDDQAEYDVATRRIVVRLGTGANSIQGGTVAIGESATIKFRATIDLTAGGTISNQAIVTADGLKGNPTTTYPTGNGTTPGTPTTTPVIDGIEAGVDAAVDASDGALASDGPRADGDGASRADGSSDATSDGAAGAGGAAGADGAAGSGGASGSAGAGGAVADGSAGAAGSSGAGGNDGGGALADGSDGGGAVDASEDGQASGDASDDGATADAGRDAAQSGDGANLDNGGSIEGGGCTCTMARSRRTELAGAWVVGLAALAIGRRRGRGRKRSQ